ncbi:MAG: hypothetical protein ACU0EF_00940, partial [Roseovarius sp.]
QRDNDRLLETLKRLRDLGNTVIVVEHDEDAILTADHVVDIGPAAGVHGGQIIAAHPERGLAVAISSDPMRPARSGGYFGDLIGLIEGPIAGLA